MSVAGAMSARHYLTNRIRRSLVSLELPFPPMVFFAIGIEHSLNMTVQRLHDPDARHHRRPAARYQHPHFDRRLPLRQVGFFFLTGW
jgi:hypothetical protein